MFSLVVFLEKLFRKISLRIKYHIVIHNYHTSIKRFKPRNEKLFRNGFDKKLLSAFVKKWSVFNHPFSTEPFKVYSVTSGINSINFIPDNLFYWIVEPTLNRLKTNFAYSDKNIYEKVFSSEFFPRGILHCVNNSFYDHDYTIIKSLDQKLLENLLADYQQVIMKPATDSRGGRNIQRFVKKNGTFLNSDNQELSSEFLYCCRTTDFIIQESIQSHPFYARFNPTSLNTLRLVTYRSVKTEKIEIVCGVFRIGAPGSIVDNLHSGGTAIGIDKTGKMNPFGIDGDAHIVYQVLVGSAPLRIADIGMAYKYDLMADAARKVAKQVLNFRLISFDICIDSEGSPRIIELNIGNQGTAFLQAANGPLLGEFTDEIIAYCLANKKVRTHILV